MRQTVPFAVVISLLRRPMCPVLLLRQHTAHKYATARALVTVQRTVAQVHSKWLTATHYHTLLAYRARPTAIPVVMVTAHHNAARQRIKEIGFCYIQP